MKRHRLRSASLTSILLILAGMFWLYLAPSQLGGSTTYVVTHGISMEPRFHTGDLALVRPAARYQVGDIAAYHSSLLHTVVLHRIIAIRHGHYYFKGDNNDFVDSAQPTRDQIVGKLWLHIAHAGVVMNFLHTPAAAGAVAGLLGLMLIGGSSEQRRRGKRRQRRPTAAGGQGASPMNTKQQDLAGSFDLRAWLTAAVATTVVLLGIVVFAFASPASKPATHGSPYSQTVSFGYHAALRPGPVYPTGNVTTGDPIFLQLVHRLAVDVSYRLNSVRPTALQGTEQVVLKLSEQTGWSRTIPVTPTRSFTGHRFRTVVSLDLASLQMLFDKVDTQTGIADATGTIAVQTKVHVRGRLANRVLTSSFAPALTFQLGQLQLTSSGASTSAVEPGAGSDTAAAIPGAPSASTPTTYVATRNDSVSTNATVRNVVSVVGVSIAVGTLRFLAAVGFLIALASALALTVLTAHHQALGESARIRSQYGHMIVPITAGEDLGWPAIDVKNIKALVRLAQASGQLILHSHGTEADTYLVNDEGSVYRYQVQLPKIAWGEWTAPSTELVS